LKGAAEHIAPGQTVMENRCAPECAQVGRHWQNGASKRRRFAFVGRAESGGAGIRTPVREKIDHSVYVRVPLIEVSSRWPMDSPLLDKSFLISPTTW